MLCDKLLQLLHLCLHFRVRRVFALHPAECRHDVHQLTAHVLDLFLGLVGSFFLKLFVFRRFAPFLFGLLGILLDLLRIKCGKVHNLSSCGSNFLRKADQIFKMLLFQCQKCDLLFQCFLPVKSRILHDFLDVLQRKFQFPEQ